MSITIDKSVYFDSVNGLGVAAVVDGVSVDGMLSNEYVPSPNGMQAARNYKTFTGLTSELSATVEGDSVVLDSVNYEVAGPPIVNQDFTRLRLNAV